MNWLKKNREMEVPFLFAATLTLSVFPDFSITIFPFFQKFYLALSKISLWLLPPRECGTRRTPAPDRDGSSRNDMRSLWPVERCSRLMCVEKSDQVSRWFGSPPGVEAHIGQITSWESCDESECAEETWSTSDVSVYPRRPQNGHVRDCGCTIPAAFSPE